MKNIAVSKIIDTKGSSQVLALPPRTSLREMVTKASELNIGAFLVNDEKGKLAGIITERDVVRLCAKKVDFDKVSVGEVMTKNIITIAPEEDITKAMDLIISKKIRHLPVVSGSELVGLITIRDLLYAMKKTDDEELKMFIDYLQTAVDEA